MKKGILPFLVFLFLLPIVSLAAERQFIFNNYTHSDGLPDDSITGIAQDGFGFVWVGTKEGICRYDGYSFCVPPEVEKVNALNSTITSFHIDSKNILWALTDDCVVRLDLNSGECSEIKNKPDNGVFSICSDDEGRLWTSTSKGIVIYSNDLVEKENLKSSFKPTRIYKGANGAMWLISSEGLIYGYDRKRNTVNPMSAIDHQLHDKGAGVRNVCSVDSRNIIISDSNTNIYAVNVEKQTSSLLLNVQSIIKGALLQSMIAVDPDELWLPTDKGLIVFDRFTGKIKVLVYDSSKPQSLCGSNLRSVFKDSFGRIWVGSFFSGISCMEESPFFYYTGLSNHTGDVKGKTIRAFAEDNHGNIWMASEDGYIIRKDKNGEILFYGHDIGLPVDGNYQAITVSENLVYVGAYGDGVFIINPTTHSIEKKYSVGNNNLASLLVTRNGEIYAGASDGLFFYDRERDEFVPVKDCSGFVHAMRQDRDGHIWIGYYRGRLRILDPSTKEVSVVKSQDPNIEPGLVRTTSLYEDQSGDIWMTTEGKGVYKIDPVSTAEGTYRIINLRKQDGLPSDVTCGMVQSSDGLLWLSTMRGIVSMNMDGEIISVNRLSKIGNFFRYGAAMLSDDGFVYMGTAEGALQFNPADMKHQSYSLLISSITFGRGDTHFCITEDGHSSMTTSKVKIHSRDASYIRINLASAGPVTDNGLEYFFRLYKKRTMSETVSDLPSITYANLTPGHYSIDVGIMGENSDKVLNTLQLQVIPPFFLNTFMRSLYVILLFLLMVGLGIFARYNIRKKRLDSERKMEESMQKELYESKINFFTNISHEIRTHLTLIKLSIDNILKKHESERGSFADVQTNIDKLIEFSNQVLDLRKVDTGKMMLNYAASDMNVIFRNVCRNYIPVAETYSVHLSFETKESQLVVYCASSCIEKILSNLLMNGIKYCKSEVRAQMYVDCTNLVISVYSDGNPISMSERAMIFKPFYQSPEAKSNISSLKGSGLGLPLSRSLAELHGGSLILEDGLNQGNTFILSIPLRRVETDDGSLGQSSDIDSQSGDVERTTILIVEDDINLNNYIRKCFSDSYRVLQASNGIEGLNLLGKYPVDIVLSDIKMPEMDGCELCNRIKTTVEYSHIPVILLTAITDDETQIATLRSGADAFITKPFSLDLLTATVENIFRNREIMAKKFKMQPMSDESLASGNEVEDEFMKQLYEYVSENCSNPDLLSVSNIASHMCVSRSTLFRKVKAKVNCNVNEYVMTCRLRKAASLLSTGKYRINEVAANVGITSSSYFAKLFQKQYGISPSSYLESLQQKNIRS